MTRSTFLLGAMLLGILASLPASAAVAAFPGGNGRIAYSGTAFSDPGEPIEPPHIFTVLPDGSGKQQLTDAPIADFQPSWSADGRRLVFVRGGPTGAVQLFTMNADGSNQAKLADISVREPCIDPCPSPAFSPSGRRIVYSTGQEIVTVRSDGSNRHRLLEATSLRHGGRLTVDGSPYRASSSVSASLVFGPSAGMGRICGSSSEASPAAESTTAPMVGTSSSPPRRETYTKVPAGFT